mmetsp:Transcript_16112/g.43812  ORF Transcript_16112/g.43812 Transcript_16112/m.43812 type:complete len:201 (+) Transcript_16112:3145-3747(+)
MDTSGPVIGVRCPVCVLARRSLGIASVRLPSLLLFSLFFCFVLFVFFGLPPLPLVIFVVQRNMMTRKDQNWDDLLLLLHVRWRRLRVLHVPNNAHDRSLRFLPLARLDGNARVNRMSKCRRKVQVHDGRFARLPHRFAQFFLGAVLAKSAGAVAVAFVSSPRHFKFFLFAALFGNSVTLKMLCSTSTRSVGLVLCPSPQI